MKRSQLETHKICGALNCYCELATAELETSGDAAIDQMHSSTQTLQELRAATQSVARFDIANVSLI